jgi:hypothetical protein
MRKIVFFNPCRNGDIHVSRTYIQDIIIKLGSEYEYFYEQNPNFTKGFLLSDIKNLNYISGITQPDSSSIVEKNDIIYINTWYAQSNWKYDSGDGEVNFYILYNIFKDVYNYLKIKIEDLDFYKPKVNYENLYLKDINDLIELGDNFRKKVLVCSNPVQSGQSFNFNFNQIVDQLSRLNTDVIFYVTSDLNINSNNVIQIVNNNPNRTDLNEISYLSTKCDVIVGRSSGAYTFSIVKENLDNLNKYMVCFSKNILLTTGYKEGFCKCNQIWSDDYSLDNILQKINTCLDNGRFLQRSHKTY